MAPFLPPRNPFVGQASVVAVSNCGTQGCIEAGFIRIERPFGRVEWLKTYPRGILKWQRLLQRWLKNCVSVLAKA
ncbi:hypothetical protein PLUA15_160112 [Pseudomonas lundensis]|uniref:Uncharacterized protein n=1 Tax=Pseudomonas lundensis TaxID=86185 RepID=A0AAX2H311_9PSED|nr:hypothetical protein PLUA15_160112 [Pseudomonas lundensis]